MSETGDNNDKRKEADPPPRGTKEGKDHWEKVEMYCEYEGSLEPECIDAYYGALDKENWLEWWIMLGAYFQNQPIIALFGLPLSAWAAFCSFYFLIWPDRAPSIADAPWDHVPLFFRGIIIILVTWTAGIVKPNFFFLTQVLTLGASDMSDLELIYMKGYEPSLYFALEAISLPWLQLPAFMTVFTFWWLYAAEFVYFFGEIFFWALFGGSPNPEYYYEKNGLRDDDDEGM